MPAPFASWRLVLTGSLIAAGVALWAHARHEHGRAERAAAAAARATRQASLNAEATRALDAYHAKTVTIRKAADDARRTVQAAPGADAPLPEGLRARLCDGLGELRHGPVCTGDPAAALAP